jgi:hypothetical protein
MRDLRHGAALIPCALAQRFDLDFDVALGAKNGAPRRTLRLFG